jgi:hypothetical protein
MDDVPSTSLAQKRKRIAPTRYDDDYDESEVVRRKQITESRHNQLRKQRIRTEASITVYYVYYFNCDYSIHFFKSSSSSLF